MKNEAILQLKNGMVIPMEQFKEDYDKIDHARFALFLLGF